MLKEREQELRQERDHTRRTEELASVGGWEIGIDDGSIKWTLNGWTLLPFTLTTVSWPASTSPRWTTSVPSSVDVSGASSSWTVSFPCGSVRSSTGFCDGFIRSKKHIIAVERNQ